MWDVSVSTKGVNGGSGDVIGVSPVVEREPQRWWRVPEMTRVSMYVIEWFQDLSMIPWFKTELSVKCKLIDLLNIFVKTFQPNCVTLSQMISN